MKIQDKKIIGKARLARYLGISITTLLKKELDQKIPHTKVGERNAYAKSAVEWYLEK